MEKPLCRKCLLSEMADQQALLASVQELIALLPEEKRADDQTRAQRLSQCRECSHLNDGTCGLCGCFVELRTAKAWLHCPAVPPLW
ncbi:MAG: hypothetical protein E7324_01365 [Clostridiales bacterium]|nr:hypothetical protein [Clostridiales bacterium]